MSLVPGFLSGLGLTLISGKLILAGKFIVSRVAAWTGTVYFYRRGKATGLRRYYVTAVSVYLVSWILILLSSAWAWHVARKFLS